MSNDKPAVEEIAQRLRRQGVEPWLDMWNLIPGKAWQPDIEQQLGACLACAVIIGPSGIGPWQHEEMRLAIARRVTNPESFAVIPVLLPGVDRPQRSDLPGFLTSTTWVEFRRSLDEAEPLRRLVCGVRGEEPTPVHDTPLDKSLPPYRGLRQFHEKHARFFFGREALTEWLVDALRPRTAIAHENRLLAVVGASGSGKSSLVRAGLIPALRDNAVDGSENWPMLICRPGSDPLESLVMALAHDETIGPHVTDEVGLIQQFRDSERALHLKIRRALHDQDETRRVLIYVDQFEEIFTLCRDGTLRKAAIDNLLYAATIAQGRTVVVLSMRADFYGRCASYPNLAEALSNHQELVGPMTAEELRRAIERPAQMVGCELEPGLVELLIEHASNEPGRLPLLQHTLDRLWEKRKGRRLTIDAYNDMGQLEGALQKYADDVFQDLDEPEQKLCRQIFMRLTQLGEGSEDTKRRTPLGEFQNDRVSQLVDRLATARLLTKETADPAQDEGYVEVAHEALIRKWGRFRQWIDADRESHLVHRRLTNAANEWNASRREASFLYDGLRLRQAEQLRDSCKYDLTETEKQFLAAARTRRRLKKLGVGGGIAAALLMVAGLITMTVWAINNRDAVKVEKARGILSALKDRPGFPGTDLIPELNAVEYKSLCEIAASRDDRLRLLCISEAFRDPDLASRWIGRGEAVTNAFVGINASRRMDALQLVRRQFDATHAQGHPRDSARLQLSVLLVGHLRATDQDLLAGLAADWLEQSILTADDDGALAASGGYSSIDPLQPLVRALETPRLISLIDASIGQAELRLQIEERKFQGRLSDATSSGQFSTDEDEYFHDPMVWQLNPLLDELESRDATVQVSDLRERLTRLGETSWRLYDLDQETRGLPVYRRATGLSALSDDSESIAVEDYTLRELDRIAGNLKDPSRARRWLDLMIRPVENEKADEFPVDYDPELLQRVVRELARKAGAEYVEQVRDKLVRVFLEADLLPQQYFIACLWEALGESTSQNPIPEIPPMDTAAIQHFFVTSSNQRWSDEQANSAARVLYTVGGSSVSQNEEQRLRLKQLILDNAEGEFDAVPDALSASTVDPQQSFFFTLAALAHMDFRPDNFLTRDAGGPIGGPFEFPGPPPEPPSPGGESSESDSATASERQRVNEDHAPDPPARRPADIVTLNSGSSGHSFEQPSWSRDRSNLLFFLKRHADHLEQRQLVDIAATIIEACLPVDYSTEEERPMPPNGDPGLHNPFEDPRYAPILPTISVTDVMRILADRYRGQESLTPLIDKVATALDVRVETPRSEPLSRSPDFKATWDRLRDLPGDTFAGPEAMVPERAEIDGIRQSDPVLAAAIGLHAFQKGINREQARRLAEKAFLKIDSFMSYPTWDDASYVRGLATVIAVAGPKLPNGVRSARTREFAEWIGQETAFSQDFGSLHQTSLVLAIDGLIDGTDQSERLTDSELLNYLKLPHCVGFFRFVVLKEFSERYKKDFESVWDLVDYLEKSEPMLAEKARSPHQLDFDD